MSRTALAAAYDVVLPLAQPETRHRVLGGGETPWDRVVRRSEVSRVPYEPEVELVPVAPSMASDGTWQASRLFAGRRLILAGTALGLCLLAAVPALAGASTQRPLSLRVSGYTEIGMGQTAGADPVPVIDVSTAPASEAPPPALEEAPPQPAVQPYSVLGPPSTSVAQIERVLRQYGSPAAGRAAYLYDLGVRYGIDPAYALAFFVHESGCGTKGVARFTQSLGNIRWTEGFENYEGYRKYASWEAGMEDWYRLITDLYINGWGLKTVDDIIPVYAPWGDNNNPPGYIASIKAMVDNWRGK